MSEIPAARSADRDRMPRAAQYCPISLLFCDEIAPHRDFSAYSESFL